jgi:hypothetical protein
VLHLDLEEARNIAKTIFEQRGIRASFVSEDDPVFHFDSTKEDDDDLDEEDGYEPFPDTDNE